MVEITKVDGTYYMSIDGAEVIALEVKQPNGWDPTIFLPENPTGRKLINCKVADAKLEKGQFILTDKAVRTPGIVGARSASVPNRALVEHLKSIDFDEVTGKTGIELHEEYMAIIEAAKVSMAADKAKPMTELEKAKAKLERARAALEALEAQAGGTI